MNFSFKGLTFEVSEGKIILTDFKGFRQRNRHNFAEIQIAGENRPSHAGTKTVYSSEAGRLKYISHSLTENRLSVVQESELITAETVFVSYDDTDTVRIYTEVTAKEELVLEQVSAIVIGGISPLGNADADNVYLTRFIQSHHTECQPRRASFAELGFISDGAQQVSQKKISFANVGSWSTKEALPQCIIENSVGMLMFQIESNSSWYYEISDRDGDIYLYLGGADSINGAWSKRLSQGESYRTPAAALAFGGGLNEVLAEMTAYRRHICGLSEIDSSLPSIFNEYMHLSWDNPTQEATKIYAPIVAKTGVKYYVIDCGWHDEADTKQIYAHVGRWKESNLRFPEGVRKTTDFIRSLGMKAGLWIEPEMVGPKCSEMLDFYTDDCFLQRYGKKVCTGRYFLDYRNPRVIEYMSETVRRMVEDYGADYIKFDYNQDAGIGTDLDSDSMGEGLESCANAFLDWVSTMKKRFPRVIFEGCASGGMRMDYKSLSVFSLQSTSDQIDYLKYPYIAANVLSAVLPEQAAVWSYPVGCCTAEQINDNQIVMNMINSFLGRMHLASHLERMTDRQLELVTEGVRVYNSLTEFKKGAFPYLPCDFAKYGDSHCASGIRKGNTVYLAVWCLGGGTKTELPVAAADAETIYPPVPNAKITLGCDSITVDFEREKTAIFIKITLKENKQ